MDKESIYERTVAGKRVVFRRRIPLSILDSMEQAGRDMRAAIPMLQTMIESWEWPGDPNDPASYGELDIIEEFMPLVQAASACIQERVGAIKN